MKLWSESSCSLAASTNACTPPDETPCDSGLLRGKSVAVPNAASGPNTSVRLKIAFMDKFREGSRPYLALRLGRLQPIITPHHWLFAAPNHALRGQPRSRLNGAGRASAAVRGTR